jgi:type I restriction enzyme M protein
MSSNQSGEGEIRRNLIEADLVDCMVALPGQLFFSTQIPVCLWFLARDRSGGSGTHPFRDRRGEVLFIDARKLGRMLDRTHRELTDDDIAQIAGTYHTWRTEPPTESRRDEHHTESRRGEHPMDSRRGEAAAEQTPGPATPIAAAASPLPPGPHSLPGSHTPYTDTPGFCKSATIEEIRKHGHVLTPGRYVGAEALEDDGEPFDAKMRRLTATLREQQAEGARLDAAIRENLEGLGFGL